MQGILSNSKNINNVGITEPIMLIPSLLYQSSRRDDNQTLKTISNRIEISLTDKDVSLRSLILSGFIIFIKKLTLSNEISLILYQGVKTPVNITIDPFLNVTRLFSWSNYILDSLDKNISEVYQKQEGPKVEISEGKEVTFYLEYTRANADAFVHPELDDLGQEAFHLVCTENEEKVTCEFINYGHIARSALNSWIENLKTIVSSIKKLPDTSIDRISWISAGEATLLKQWNLTHAPYESELCIHDKLRIQAGKTPEKVALWAGEDVLTYQELHVLSNAFANQIISNGVSTGDRMLVCLERGFGLMVAIFGILKAGAIYLPVSTKFTRIRIQEILEDANPRFSVISNSTAPCIPSGYPILNIDTFLENKHEHDTGEPPITVSSSEVAYIIYTSGTTGKPNGVMIEHTSVMNRLGWMQKAYPLTSDDVLIQKTPVTFDVSIWELFWWSFTGASLVLLQPEGEKYPEIIVHAIRKYGVTVIHFVPSMFSTFLHYLENCNISKPLATLHTIFCSGEVLPVRSVNDFLEICEKSQYNASLVNLYGPTEATVDVSYFNCIKGENRSIPIGKPIDNTQLYVVDESMQIQPFNVPGELIICGVNLARGYFGNTMLTNKKFVVIDVLGKQTRAYKTGDIAYWSEDGNIYYIGRNDNQVKLRGMRIELGEIESTIQQMAGIKNCIVLMVSNDQERSYLAAFYQKAVSTERITVNEIKEYLKCQLVDYKIPSTFIEIQKIPVNLNGKVDRKMLLSMLQGESHTISGGASSKYEKKLQEIWKRILKADHVSPTSNFFEIGGNSLLVVQMAILLKKEFQKDISVMSIMQNPTINTLAKYIEIA